MKNFLKIFLQLYVEQNAGKTGERQLKLLLLMSLSSF